MVLIPKGGSDYHIIRLVEMVWKVVTVIINQRLRIANYFHDVIHRFRAICSTGTASLKVNLIQKLISMS